VRSDVQPVGPADHAPGVLSPQGVGAPSTPFGWQGRGPFLGIGAAPYGMVGGPHGLWGAPAPPAPAYSVGGPPAAAAKPPLTKFFRRDFPKVDCPRAPAGGIFSCWAPIVLRARSLKIFPERFPERPFPLPSTSAHFIPRAHGILGPHRPKISQEIFRGSGCPRALAAWRSPRAPGAKRRGAYLTHAGRKDSWDYRGGRVRRIIREEARRVLRGMEDGGVGCLDHEISGF